MVPLPAGIYERPALLQEGLDLLGRSDAGPMIVEDEDARVGARCDALVGSPEEPSDVQVHEIVVFGEEDAPVTRRA